MKLQVIDPFHQDGVLLARGAVIDGAAADAVAADPDKRARCVELVDEQQVREAVRDGARSALVSSRPPAARSEAASAAAPEAVSTADPQPAADKE